jgi:outer membrane lipoprotein carrier protein
VTVTWIGSATWRRFLPRRSAERNLRCTSATRVFLGCALLVPPLVASAAQETSGDPHELARTLQRKYDGVRDFSADFVHTYQGGVLRKTVKESGRLVVRKPGQMRWTYTTPDEKTFVSDGRKLYSYIPADRQVYVTTVSQEDQGSTPALFLAGKGNLIRDFEVSATPTPAEAGSNSVALKLVPRSRERDYDSLVLVVDRGTLQLRSLIAEDRQGGRSSFAFSNLRENVGVSDREFVFKIPRGVDVITDTK